MIYGVCHRKTLLRSLGFDKEPDVREPAGLATDVMWKAGESNEWHWERVITAAGIPFSRTQVVSIPIEGIPKPVEGHPDVVLLDEDKLPSLTLELKGVFSYNTAEKVLKGEPKNDNLIQGAAYARALNTPLALCYTSASYIKTPGWAIKEFGTSIAPFYKIFYAVWRGDDLWLMDEDTSEWKKTLVTWKGVEDYYRLVHEMRTAKQLGNRVSSHGVLGTQHKFGELADCKYCEHAKACERYDINKDYDEWMSIVELGRNDEHSS